MKKIFLVLIIIAVAAAAWVTRESFKPRLLFKVEVTSEVLRITNGNDDAWENAEVILNDAFDGPIFVVSGFWPPNTKKELSLTQFNGRLNKQAFKPEFEKVHKVIIDVKGFQIASHKF